MIMDDEERLKKISKWHRWFAWYPVLVFEDWVNADWAFICTIERRYKINGLKGKYEYRMIEE